MPFAREFLVANQNDGENGIDELLGSCRTTAFGSHSVYVLTKIICTRVVLFFVLTLRLELVNKKPNYRKACY